MKTCLKTNVNIPTLQNTSNPKNSNSCNHLKEDELPNLNNVTVQNISQENKENSTKQSHAFTSHSRRKVKFSDINQVYDISPKKAKKSHNAPSILRTEGKHKLQEALKSIKKNTRQQHTNKSNTLPNEHTHSDSHEHQSNVFQHDLIITKQDAPNIYLHISFHHATYLQKNFQSYAYSRN